MGRNIAEFFDKLDNFDVYATGLKRSLSDWDSDKFFKVDLTNREQVNKLFNTHNFDIVIQAAATTSGSKDIVEKPYLHVTDNAVMNSLILQASSLKSNVMVKCQLHTIHENIINQVGHLRNFGSLIWKILLICRKSHFR